MSSGGPFDHATVSHTVHEFMRACALSMTVCAQSAEETEMVSRFSRAVADARPRSFTPRLLPALCNLEWVSDMKLAQDFREFAHYLPWVYSPRTLDRGEEVAIVDFGSMFDMTEVLSGLMYVDAEKTYPEHNHPPRELYFLISGTGDWRFGGNDDYRAVSAGNMLFNFPWNWHGVKAGHTPLLALYLQTH